MKSEISFGTQNAQFLGKSRRVDVCETMLSDYQDNLKWIITGDETWIYAYDQSSEYREKARSDRKEHVEVVQKSSS